MKFKKHLDDDYYEDEFTSSYNRKAHYTKHIKNRKEYDMSEEEYEKYSEQLMNTPCDYKNIFGYKVIDNNNGKYAYVKYDKEKEFMTVYNDKRKTITSFKRPWRNFTGKMYSDERFEYVDEIPRGF